MNEKASEFSTKTRPRLPVNYKESLAFKKPAPELQVLHDFIDQERRERFCRLYEYLHYLESADNNGQFDDDEINEIREIVGIEDELTE